MEHKTEYLENPRDNREYKSELFCKVFEDKKYLLDLYNCINHTEYQNADELEVNTIKNVVYITMKNDMSFLIDSNMNLYEHQSTYNPNMPLRGLLYLAQLYNKYIKKNNLNLFSSSALRIPIPQYIVFYNGLQNQPDEQVLSLSALFEKQGENQKELGCLECKARMININYGHNQELMNKCRRLEEYAIFVGKVREYAMNDMENRESAITRAIDDCIEQGILVDILKEQKAEVLELVLTTFNRELYEQGLREDAAKAAEKEVSEKMAGMLAEMEGMLAEKKEMQTEMEGMQTEMEGMQTEMEGMQTEIDDLKKQLEEKENMIAKLLAQTAE